MIAEKTPQLEKAVFVLKELSQDEETRLLYEAREKAMRDERSRINSAYADGMNKGKIETALNALNMEMDIDSIVKLTGLTIEEIEKLQ